MGYHTYLQLDWTPCARTGKITYQQRTKRATTHPTHVHKTFGEENPDLL